jgi:hypothetical protein
MQLGLSFSISQSGYRHNLSERVKRFQEIEGRFKHHFDKEILLANDLDVASFDEASWILETFKYLHHLSYCGIEGFNVEKSFRARDIVQALAHGQSGWNRMVDRYPVLREIYELFASCTGEGYKIYPDDYTCQLDEWLARSLVTSPYKFRREILNAIPHLHRYPIGEALVTQTLHTHQDNYLSEKLVDHYRSLRQWLADPRQEPPPVS